MAIISAGLITPVGRANPLIDGHVGFRLKVQRYLKKVRAYIGGGIPKSTGVQFSRDVKRSFGSLAISGSSGTVGCVINGVTVTVSHGTTDTLDGGLLVTAVNASADALIAGLVEAGQLAGTLAFSGAKAGVTFNVCGFVFKAVGTATPAGNDEFTIAGNDTADAASAAAAINKHPVASQFLCATNSTSTVTVWCTRAAIPSGFTNTLVGATGITAGATTLAAGAAVYITAIWPGTEGNMCTLAASGTGWTASGARLTGGTTSTSETP